jgi:hypothetical protein
MLALRCTSPQLLAAVTIKAYIGPTFTATVVPAIVVMRPFQITCTTWLAYGARLEMVIGSSAQQHLIQMRCGGYSEPSEPFSSI